MTRLLSISTSESADTDPVLVESRHQFRLLEFAATHANRDEHAHQFVRLSGDCVEGNGHQ